MTIILDFKIKSRIKLLVLHKEKCAFLVILPNAGHGRVCCPGNPSVTRFNILHNEKQRTPCKVSFAYWLRRRDLNLVLPSCGAQNPRALLFVAVDFDRYASSARNSAYRFFALLKKLIASLCFLSPKKLCFLGTPFLPVSSTGRGRVCCPGNPSVTLKCYLKRKNTEYQVVFCVCWSEYS